jgi:formate dehydrogenase major subunit
MGGFMGITRRDFLRLSGATALGVTLGSLGFDLTPIKAYAASLRKDLKSAKESTTICPYCAVGCGAIVHASKGKVINIEGDPDHPINLGSLCSKGSSLYQLANNKQRVTKVLYRKPYGTTWEVKSWNWAINEIAKRVKKVRDESFIVENPKGQLVNRVEAIASIGSAAMDNEECWLYQKFLRSIGLVYIEHQARI